MKSFIKSIDSQKYFLIILVLAFVLRFVNLGYSDYQGDELKALFLPESGQSVFSFLMDQRKGPVQFVVTYLLKFVDPTYDNQLLLRFPFALAGFLSVVFFYKFIKKSFGEKVALFSTFFFATNGFLVAFSRIVQYQSFVILFMILALYALSHKKIYQGLIFWAISILSHYDGVFIAPLAFYYLFIYLKEMRVFEAKSFLTFFTRAKHFFLAGLISLSLLLAFYIPFVLTLSEETTTYWAGRISGEVSDKLSSSVYLFSVYQPIYVIHFYFALAIVGLLVLVLLILRPILPKKLAAVFLDVTFASTGPLVCLLLWFLVAFIFMELFVYIPGTHIYCYLVPVFVLMGFAMSAGFNLLKMFLGKKFGVAIFSLGTVVLFSFIFLQSYAVFVDNTREYPWEEEKFLLWTMPMPTPMYHLSMFGFPYYRNWEDIRSFVSKYTDVEAYSTNERDSIARNYIFLRKSSTDAGFYVYILNSQSFSEHPSSDKVKYWISKNKPIYVYSRNNRDMTEIYLMPVGSLEELLKKGY